MSQNIENFKRGTTEILISYLISIEDLFSQKAYICFLKNLTYYFLLQTDISKFYVTFLVSQGYY